ncbi:MAG: hypothetical protein JSV79_09270 [Armatimonadota bacterium]|nr:MAG: hypothetical protein JSV79_09270 [Armatimonadota bacterium]
MRRFWRIYRYARRLFWFLELLISPDRAAEVLLNHPHVRRWLEAQPPEDQRKIREAAPLVVAAILASLD